MKKFEGISKTMIGFYFAFLIGLILSGGLFILQIVFNFVLIKYDLLLLIVLSCLGLFKVANSAIYEIQKLVKKKKKAE